MWKVCHCFHLASVSFIRSQVEGIPLLSVSNSRRDKHATLADVSGVLRRERRSFCLRSFGRFPSPQRDFPPNLPPRAFSSGIKIAPPSCAYSVVLRCAPLPRGRDFHPSVVRDVCQFRSGPSQKAKEKEGVPAQSESCTFLHSAKNYTSYPNPLHTNAFGNDEGKVGKLPQNVVSKRPQRQVHIIIHNKRALIKNLLPFNQSPR